MYSSSYYMSIHGFALMFAFLILFFRIPKIKKAAMEGRNDKAFIAFVESPCLHRGSFI